MIIIIASLLFWFQKYAIYTALLYMYINNYV